MYIYIACEHIIIVCYFVEEYECPLKVDPDSIYHFFRDGVKERCAPGTQFALENCTCVHGDGKCTNNKFVYDTGCCHTIDFQDPKCVMLICL